MIDDQPMLAALDISEAVARREDPCLPIPDVGKCVIAGVHRGIAVDADKLIAKVDPEAGKNLKGSNEIIAQGRRIGA